MNMIKMDTECKKFFKNTQRFSDLINGAFLDGNSVINENNALLWDGEETSVLEDRDKHLESKDRYRDTIIKVTIGHLSILIALENQNRNDFSMVIRTFQYDSMNYVKQWDTHYQTPKNKVIMPVVTFVIHWGEGVFSAKKKISDMGEGVMKEFEPYFHDYQMNFRDIKELDIRKFKNKDVRNAIDLIQRIYKMKRNNYEKLLDDIYVNKEILEFVSVVTNIEKLYEMSQEMKEKEEINMCQAFQEFLRERREEGHVTGFQEGRIETMVANVKALMNKLQVTSEESMDILNIPQHEKAIIYNLIS